MKYLSANGKKVNGSDTVYIIGESFENAEKRKNNYFHSS